MKKIALIFLVFVLLSSISAVCAESITIEDATFNIPDGYDSDNNIDYTTLVSVFVPSDMVTDLNLNNVETFTDGENLIGIVVIPTDEFTLDDIKDNIYHDKEKTISDKSGLLGNSSVIDVNGTLEYEFSIFKYFENGKFYLVAAPDEATIEEILA